MYGYSSFLAFPKLWGISRGASYYVEFSIGNAASLNDSLLVYMGSDSENSGIDYLALGMRRGKCSSLL